MSEKTIQIAICKWSERLTASYFPVNQLYSYNDPVTGLQAKTRFDAYGRQIGDPDFGVRRLFVTEETNDNGYTYTTFQSDLTSSILIYKSIGSLEAAYSEGGGGGGSVDTSKMIETSSSLPNPTEGNLGKTYQFIGTTTASFTKYHFYTCEFVGGAYVWSDTTPQGSVLESVTINGETPQIINKNQSFTIKPLYSIPSSVRGTTETYPLATTKQFCDDLVDQTKGNAKSGMMYSGTVFIGDTPPGGRAEITVEVMGTDEDPVLLLRMNSTNTGARSWVSMYYNGAMEYGTTDCPWFACMLSPIDSQYDQKTKEGSTLIKKYRGASEKYVDDAVNGVTAVRFASTLPSIQSATRDCPYLLTESDQSGHVAGKIYILKTGATDWEIVNKGYPVGDCSNIRCFKMTDSTTVRLKWKDPVNPHSEGVDLAKWKQTTVVRKTGGYPANASDGTVVVTSTVRDQYDVNNLIDTVPDASQTYYYGFFPETEEGVVTLSDGTSNRAVTGTISYATLRDLTRTGELSSIIEVGTSLEVNHSTFGSIEVQIAGYDAVLPVALRYVAQDNSTVYLKYDSKAVGSTVYSDEALQTPISDTVSAISGQFVIGNHSQNGRENLPLTITVGGKTYTCAAHSTVLYSRYLLPASNGSANHFTCQFDASELQYAASEDTNYLASKTYYSYDGVSTYTALVAGTDYQVGDPISTTVYEKNNDSRKNYGYGRWSQSGIRQYLNADSASNWWVKKNIFDTQPNVAGNPGFLYGLDSSFKSCLGKVACKIAKNTVDAGGGFEFTEDLIFLPSQSEMFNQSLNGGYDGSQFTLCQGFTDATRKKCTKVSSQSSNPSYQWYWLRSPNTGYVHYAYNVANSGGSNGNNAINAYGVAFACALI